MVASLYNGRGHRLDRTGLLYELTATLSKLNLNIASAHVATFGERVVDVFYVTDLMARK
jgi:[protein-PII] uridylyltransferase